MDILQQIADARILPLLKITHVEDAPPLYAALCSSGMTAVLISMQTADAPAVLRQGNRLFPDLLLGAEGVASAADAVTAIDCGAQIIASNGFSGELEAICAENGACYIPFCLSPTELLTHQLLGGKITGVFSPEAFGRVSSISALHTAFPHLSLLPSNIPLDKLAAYLSQSGVIACLCPEITEGSPNEVIAKCLKAKAMCNG